MLNIMKCNIQSFTGVYNSKYSEKLDMDKSGSDPWSEKINHQLIFNKSEIFNDFFWSRSPLFK